MGIWNGAVRQFTCTVYANKLEMKVIDFSVISQPSRLPIDSLQRRRNLKAADNDSTALEWYSSRRIHYLKKSSRWEYRKRSRALRAVTSAWQSLTTCPWSLRYSPLIHLVPVDNATTWACLRSRPVEQLHTDKWQPYCACRTFQWLQWFLNQ